MTMTRPYQVEMMLESDLDDVVDIEEETGLNRWGYEAYRRELLKNPNSVMLVARNLEPGVVRPGILGFFAGWTVEDELHVNNIAAHPKYRRLGIGTSLMEAAIDEGRLRGVRVVLLEVRASNAMAQLLYRRLGFRFIARRRDYYRSPTEDALVMKLVLD
ncbi:MAG TPA: ribosomal protein S18-alanine N-acetyltransferase [Blastocatellia bacterium]|nr:ribosomal protein S18-alanine N-acetyltransferase [Blastocatellia bacterium]